MQRECRFCQIAFSGREELGGGWAGLEVQNAPQSVRITQTAMQLSHCRWNAFLGVALHVTPSGGSPDRGGGTPRPGRFGAVQSNSRITRSAACDAARPLSAN